MNLNILFLNSYEIRKKVEKKQTMKHGIPKKLQPSYTTHTHTQGILCPSQPPIFTTHDDGVFFFFVEKITTIFYLEEKNNFCLNGGKSRLGDTHLMYW